MTSSSRSAAGSGFSPNASRRARASSTWSKSMHAARAELGGALASFGNVALHAADAVTVDLRLHPAPAKVIANLPYSVAATVILKTIDELPSVRQWVVMVQREVGERFAARQEPPPTVCRRCSPSSYVTSAYCVPSARTVFRPVPNVDSVLLGLIRSRPGAWPA